MKRGRGKKSPFIAKSEQIHHQIEINLYQDQICFMRQTFMPCIDCLIALSTYHAGLGELWQQIAAESTPDDPWLLVEILEQHFADNLEVLEQHGYIVSHETDRKYLLVQIQGFEPGSHLICIHRHLK